MSARTNNEDFQDQIDPGAEVADAEATDAEPRAIASPQEIEQLRVERDTLFDRLARATADFQNARKRLEAESEQRLQYANATLLKSLLPVIDNLERAMSVDVNKTDVSSVIKGLQVLGDQFMKVLVAQDVEPIEPKPGDAFDPTRHEALMHQQNDRVPPGAVTQTLQKGYTLRDRVLRPAQVAVAK
jgi:molecular chaperone GrpE